MQKLLGKKEEKAESRKRYNPYLDDSKSISSATTANTYMVGGRKTKHSTLYPGK
jgi:hypothetical protein